MRDLRRKNDEQRFEGIGVCQGVSIGRAFLVDDPQGRIVRLFLPHEQIEAEIVRFHQAVDIAQQQVQEAIDRLRTALGTDRAYILEAHLLLLQDFTAEELLMRRGVYCAPAKYLCRAGGTIFFGHAEAWAKWVPEYYRALGRHMDCDAFAGIDQLVMNTVIIGRPDLVRVVRPTYRPEDGDPWFYLQRVFLAGGAPESAEG